jgi:hypothetical protein
MTLTTPYLQQKFLHGLAIPSPLSPKKVETVYDDEVSEARDEVPNDFIQKYRVLHPDLNPDAEIPLEWQYELFKDDLAVGLQTPEIDSILIKAEEIISLMLDGDQKTLLQLANYRRPFVNTRTGKVYGAWDEYVNSRGGLEQKIHEDLSYEFRNSLVQNYIDAWKMSVQDRVFKTPTPDVIGNAVMDIVTAAMQVIDALSLRDTMAA